MTGSTHVGIGLLAGALAPAVGLPGPEGLASWLALAAGTLAPDLDGGGLITRPRAWLPAIVPLPAAVDRAGRAVGRMANRALRHRGVLHYPLVVVALGLLSLLLHSPVLSWFAVGYASHLLADSLTKGGIPLLGPLSKRRYRLLPRALCLSTGGRLEALLLPVVWLGFVGLSLLSFVGLPGLPGQGAIETQIYLPFMTKW